MKHTSIVAIITAVLLAIGCVDDFKLLNRMQKLEERATCFEALCRQKSASIDSLQAIIDELSNNEMKGYYIATEEFDSIALLQKSLPSIVCDSIENDSFNDNQPSIE